MSKPRIGIIPGDPSGIGPELIAKLLSTEDVKQLAHILLIGDRHVFEAGMRVSGCEFGVSSLNTLDSDWKDCPSYPVYEVQSIHPESVRVAEISKESGESVLKTLDQALNFATDGIIDAIFFGPFNKASLHLANMGHEDELHYMAGKLGVTGYVSELNNLNDLWTSRVTSHIPLRNVADTINEERIIEAVVLIEKTLRSFGLSHPRIAVAALNPHAGDNGNFGTEEIDLLIPTIQKLSKMQISVSGPWPSDTVFLKAVAGELDAVVTMYHDQGQIALKLLGFDRGVTVQGGLPFPVATPAHGTAFDIAGQGIADIGAARAAFDLICRLAAGKGD